MTHVIPPAIIRPRAVAVEPETSYRLFSGDTEVGTVTYHSDGHSTLRLASGESLHTAPRRYCENRMAEALKRG